MRVLSTFGLALLLAACGGSGGGDEAPDTPAIVVNTSFDPTVGTPYATTIELSGFQPGPVRWHLVDGALPPGLGLGLSGVCPFWAAFQRTGTLDTTLPGTLLQEVSGIVASRRNPGIYWVHDDSGAASVIHAIESDGTLRQTYMVNIPHIDWEDMALGPGPGTSTEYLYVADVGDNSKNRTDVRLLRMPEPIVPATPQPTIFMPHAAFYFQYPGGAIDCEALVIDWATGTPYFLEKNELGGGDVFKLPMPLDVAWNAANPTTAIAVTSSAPLPAFVTGADASRDGQRIVVRTYFGASEHVRAAGASFDSVFTQPPCFFTIPSFQQYEAVAYSPSGWGMVTTTERVVSESGIFTSIATVSGETLDLRGVPTASGTFSFEVEAEHPDGTRARHVIVVMVRP